MSQTMLQLVQQVTAELNLAVPNYVAGNQSQDVQQILALMNGAGYDLVKEHDWQALQVQYRFYTQAINTIGTAVNGSLVLTIDQNIDLSSVTRQWQITGYNINQDTNVVIADNTTKQIVMSQMASGTGSGDIVLAQTAYDLPPDFETITDRTHWDKTKHWEMLGPEDAQQWQWLKSGYISTGPRIRWRILDNQFQIWPPMNTNEYLGWEYRSKGWARSSTGEIKNSFTQDSDTTVYDDRLLVLYTKLKYFQIKSFDTTALNQDYMRYLSVVKANDKGAPNLSFAPYPSKVLIGYANIPDTGYGS
jgi:predicted GNAT superfamily acetyltransferase